MLKRLSNFAYSCLNFKRIQHEPWQRSGDVLFSFFSRPIAAICSQDEDTITFRLVCLFLFEVLIPVAYE